MKYKDYEFDIDLEEIIPPIGKMFRFAAKPTYMRSPNGKVLWKGFHVASIEERHGRDKKEAEEKAIETAKKWIDDQLLKEKIS